MQRTSFLSFSEKGTKFTLFLFFSLLILSTAFFVFADDVVNTKNIFQDSDQDGLSNDEEKLYGTNPSVKDTDGDGYGDGIEVESGYDPLKPAPGDKIIKESSSVSSATSSEESENLTQKAASEIVNILKSTDENGQAVSLDDVNESVQKVLSGSVEEVTLPDVDIKDIKIKKGPSKNLSEKKRAEQERSDITEYLTVVSYIIANNSPQSFRTENEFVGLISSLATQSISSLAGGNTQQLNALSGVAEKILEQLKEVEVPAAMLDLHIKALKMAKYSLQLNKNLKIDPTDPFGQIAEFSKWQGFLGVTSEYFTELEAKLTEYNIKEVPIEL